MFKTNPQKLSLILLCAGIFLLFTLFVLLMRRCNPMIATTLILLLPSVLLALVLRLRLFIQLTTVQRILAGLTVASVILGLVCAAFAQTVRDLVALLSAIACGLLIRRLRQKEESDTALVVQQGPAVQTHESLPPPSSRQEIVVPAQSGTVQKSRPESLAVRQVQPETRQQDRAIRTTRAPAPDENLKLAELLARLLVAVARAETGKTGKAEQKRIQPFLRATLPDTALEGRIKKALKQAQKTPEPLSIVTGECRQYLALAPRLLLLDLVFRFVHAHRPKVLASERRLAREMVQESGMTTAVLRHLEAGGLPEESEAERVARLVREKRLEQERQLRNWQELQWQKNQPARPRAPSPNEVRALALLGLEAEVSLAEAQQARADFLALYQAERVAHLDLAFRRLAAEKTGIIEQAFTYLQGRAGR